MSEWGSWIEHDGKGCPCVGWQVHVVVGVDPYTGRFPCDDPGGWVGDFTEIAADEAVGTAVDDEGWRWQRGYYPIIRYRIRKPRGLTILENLIVEIDAPERVTP